MLLGWVHMNKFDRVFGGALLGFIIHIVSLYIFWWGIYLSWVKVLKINQIGEWYI